MIARYAGEGPRVFGDRSLGPYTSPHKLSATLTDLLVTTREAHPLRGARKLLALLQAEDPRIRECRPPSTVADLLACRCYVQRCQTRRPSTRTGVIPAVADAPNAMWRAAFKDQFRTGDHAYCTPLTVDDVASRYLLTCHGLRTTKCDLAKPIFEWAFREYGLPRAIRADYGPPSRRRPSTTCGS